MSLRAENLGFQMARRALLEAVDLEVMPAETLGLVGPNGSGKSTLLRLLAGLWRPTYGRVWLDGRDMRGMPRREIARTIAMVAQQADTGERISVRQAVALGRTPFLGPLQDWSAQDDAIVADALARVGMTALAERSWHSLSGGERQRAHIARALAQQPRILLLDEPTNHLDIRHQLRILQLVRELPITVVIALHDLNQALSCDRLAVIDGGRLIALDTPEKVLSVEQLRDTFGVHARLLRDPQGGEPVLHFRQLR
ncbi:ABC transporter ATP-binding protein [Kushneria aurantia]|uniref:ABC transporter ATP-binding protein n=1 Tax=Kushneria aurantia TaxID=504092 RepID=A0ABV6G8U4_9GAMM|nr:ABC transporter ATP-binding protein [Kushneria aurantia]